MFNRNKDKNPENEDKGEEFAKGPVTEAQEGTQGVGKSEEVPKQATIPEEDYLKLKEAAEAERKEKEEWKNKAYMAYADTANLRKSLEADHRQALRYRAEGFIENLLPALNSLYMALQATPSSQEAKNYQQGFTYIYNQIQAALSSEGISEIVPKTGEAFNPASMHAMDVEETEGEPNKVTFVYSKGYYLHDKLIKPAMVRVSRKKEQQLEEASKADSAAVDKEANKA